MLGLVLSFGTGCALSRTEPRDVAKVGAVRGGLAGAGTGVLIGAVIPAGDVAASALLGATIGAPAGALLAYYAVSSENDRELAKLDRAIDNNAEELRRKRLELIEMRRQVNDESALISPDPSRKVYDPFPGATLGRSRP